MILLPFVHREYARRMRTTIGSYAAPENNREVKFLNPSVGNRYVPSANSIFNSTLFFIKVCVLFGAYPPHGDLFQLKSVRWEVHWASTKNRNSSLARLLST